MENNFQEKDAMENYGVTSDDNIVNENADSSYKLDDNATHPGDFFLEESAESAYLDGQFSFYDNGIDLGIGNYSYSNERNKNPVDYQLPDDKYLENLRHGSSLFSLGSSYPQNKNIRSTTGWNNYYSSLQQERNHTVDLSTPTEITPSISAVPKNENQFNSFFCSGSTASTTISNRSSLSVSPLEARNSTDYDSRNYITFDENANSKPPKDSFKFDHIDEMIKPNAKRAISTDFNTIEDDYSFQDNITTTTVSQINSNSRQSYSTDDRDRNYEDTNTHNHNKSDLNYLHPSTTLDLDYTLSSSQDRFTLSDLNNFGESEYSLADHKLLTSNLQLQHQGRYDPKPYTSNFPSSIDIDNNIFNEPTFINDYTGAINHNSSSSSKMYYNQDNRQGGYAQAQAQAQAQENMNNQFHSQTNYGGGNYSVKLGHPPQQLHPQHLPHQQQQQQQQQQLLPQNKHRPPAPPSQSHGHNTPPAGGGGYSTNTTTTTTHSHSHRGFTRSTSPPSHHPSVSPDLPLQFAQLDRQREVNRRRTPPLTTSYQHQQQHQQPFPSTTTYHQSPGISGGGSTSSSSASTSNPPSRGHTPTARPISPQINNSFTVEDRMTSPPSQHFSDYTTTTTSQHPLLLPSNKASSGNKIQPAPGEAQAMSNMMLEEIVVNGCYDILKEAAKHSLKAVELANTLRARVGTEILAVVRERWGGLLSLLDIHSDLFFVERIPKNDCVTLIIGNGLIQSVSGQSITNNASMRPRTQNPKAMGSSSSSGFGSTSPGITHYPGGSSSSNSGDRNRYPPSRGNTPPMSASSTGNPSYYNPSPPLLSPPLPVHHQHQPPQQHHRDSPISCSLHIISIPCDITEVQLRREFEQYGPLECLNVVSLRDRRFAIITYYQIEHAINAKNKLSRYFPWKNMISFAKKVPVTTGDPIPAYHIDPSNAGYGYTIEAPPPQLLPGTTSTHNASQYNQPSRQLYNERTSMIGSSSSSSRDGYPYDKGYHSILSPSFPSTNDPNYTDQQLSSNRFNMDDFDPSHQLGVGGVGSGVGSSSPGGGYDYNSNASSRTSSIVSPPPGLGGEGGAAGGYTDSESFHNIINNSGQYDGSNTNSSNSSIRGGGAFGGGTVIGTGTSQYSTHSDFPSQHPYSGTYHSSEYAPQYSHPPRHPPQHHIRNPSSGDYHHFNLNDPTVTLPAFLVDPIGINPTDFDASVLQRLCDDTYVPTQVWQADVEKDAPFCQAILAQLQQLGGTATVSKLRGTLRHRIAAQNNIKSVALKAMLGAYPQFFMVNGNQISVVYSLSGGAGRDMMEPL